LARPVDWNATDPLESSPAYPVLLDPQSEIRNPPGPWAAKCVKLQSRAAEAAFLRAGIMKDTFRSTPIILILTFLLLLSALVLASSFFEMSLMTHEPEVREVVPSPNARLVSETQRYLSFQATAYCLFGRTFSGVPVNMGVAAADPDILPIGSVIHVKAGKYTGVYTVLDTGPAVRGRALDLYIPDAEAAVKFGRRRVQVRILRYGWKTTSPSEISYGAAG
jgi:3D (Asp-Asp-Asp) domain-containing protein